MMHMKIGVVTEDTTTREQETLYFAASELKKYLLKVIDCNISIYTLNKARPDCLSIALSKKRHDLDDSIKISTVGFYGVIEGSNARSCLIGVYRYLAEHGFVFLRPSFDIIPKNFKVLDINISETASYRHRGICIEGSVFYENIESLIDWLPKVYMNEYFIQFEAPSVFFNRWYDGRNENAGTLSDEEVMAMVKTLEHEITKRGLIYQTMGHGWTCKPFGIPASSWQKLDVSQYAHALPYVAEIDGIRQFWRDVPINTNLCYSNPVVIEKMSDCIVDYCRTHPDVDYVHIWLADGTNNNCECEECVKFRPSDFYVRLLNEVDAKLTKEGINTRLVFLIYVDLLWPPEHERLNNPDRFAMMFAPITRTYTTSFKSDEEGVMAPFERNRLNMPKKVSDNLAYLSSWQKNFKTDSFDFDYHFMWDHLKDLGYYRMAEILTEDIKGLADLGLNGFLSCQNQRTFLPTALPMQCMAAALWNRDVTFEEVKNRVLSAEFGDGAILAEGFLKSLSEYLQPEILRKEKLIETEEAVEGYKKLDRLVEDFSYTVKKQLASLSGAPRAAWENLSVFLEILAPLAKFYLERSKGNLDKALFEKVIDTAYNYRERLRDVFDVYLFDKVLHSIKYFKDI